MTEPDHIIRPLAASDREAWEGLFSAYGTFYETEFSAAVRSGVWSWLMDAGHPVSALVAEGGTASGSAPGPLIGFAHLRRTHDTFTAGPGWFLDDLYVAPQQRGAGVATALIDACVNAARHDGGGTLRWITASDNVVAQRLYDRVAARTTWISYEKEI